MYYSIIVWTVNDKKYESDWIPVPEGEKVSDILESFVLDIAESNIFGMPINLKTTYFVGDNVVSISVETMQE